MVALTMAIGFAIGVVKELIFPPVRFVLILYAIGAILAYTAIAFSFPYHTHKANTEDSSDE